MALTLTPQARAELAQGWPLVLAAALAIGVGTMGIGFYSLGLFVKPLEAEFGWSRAAVSGAATFQQFGIFLSAPVVGWLADRAGARPIAVASFVLMPLALLALSRTGNSVMAWDGLWLLVALAGAGTTPAIWARIVSLKFDQARGLALGLMLMGTGAAAMLAPALLGPVFAQSGWRSAVLVMAAVTLAVGLPASLMIGTSDRPVAGAKQQGRFEANRQTLMLGLAAGAEVDMLAYFTGRYAAIANYGATYGGVLGVFCLGAGLGPLLFGKAYDALGGYDAALLSSAGVLAVVVVLIATLGAYREEAH